MKSIHHIRNTVGSDYRLDFISPRITREIYVHVWHEVMMCTFIEVTDPIVERCKNDC
jgi:hypothetical protein